MSATIHLCMHKQVDISHDIVSPGFMHTQKYDNTVIIHLLILFKQILCDIKSYVMLDKRRPF